MNTVKLPFYAKMPLILVGLIALVYILILAQGILLPFVLSIVISILLNPVINYLVHHKLNRILAIGIVVFLLLVIGGLAGAFFISEMSVFKESFPLMQEKFLTLLSSVTTWITDHYHISQKDIDDYISKAQADLLNKGGNILGNTFATVGAQLVTALLIPIYIFLILLYKPLLLEFLRQIFGATHHNKVNEVLNETKHIVQGYLNGLLIETVIIGILSAIGLLALGINYAILFAIIGALLNIIPYIGLLIGALFPIVIALVTKPNPWYAFGVLMVYLFIKIVDNTYIFPRIVASQVKINALISILIVLAGGALWGIGGMFLAMPMIAILKVIFDRSETLEPLGFLLGEGTPKEKVKEKETQKL